MPPDSGVVNETTVSSFAFLCDNEGRIIHHFGEPGSARVLSDLSEPGGLTDFLDTVRTRGALPGWEKKVNCERTSASLVLHGSLTPRGILVLATLTPCPRADLAPSPSSTTMTEAVIPGRFNCPINPAVAQCAALIKQEDETHRLVSSVVHDFKNPISSIIGLCEYLEGYFQDSLEPEHLEAISGIQAAANTLLRLSMSISHLRKPDLELPH